MTGWILPSKNDNAPGVKRSQIECLLVQYTLRVWVGCQQVLKPAIQQETVHANDRRIAHRQIASASRTLT